MKPPRKFILTMVLTQFVVSVSSMMLKITLRSSERCSNPEPPYERNPLVDFRLQAYNKSGGVYFRGNFTIKENLKGYFFKIKTAIERPGNVIKHMNTFQKLTCKSVIPRIVLMSSNVRYNVKTCELYKGSYSFENMDFNKLDSSAYYFPIKEIGETIVFFSMYKNKGTCICVKSRYVVKNN